jgi:MFS family permease
VLLAALPRIEAFRPRAASAPMLPPALFRIRAFIAGVAVQLVFSAAQLAFFFVFTLWLQLGHHYSPTHAGLTTVAYAVGSLLVAGPATALAARLGRWLLVAGALLLAIGSAGIEIAAHHAISTWTLVPGLAVAGAGLGLLVIPLINVVLAGVPHAEAGGASGMFSTAQTLGGALGIAVIGTIFFPRVTDHGYDPALQTSLLWVIAAFLACGVLALALPRTAVDPLDTAAQEG